MYFGIFCFKQKTGYEVRMSDWSSDVCSSELIVVVDVVLPPLLRSSHHRSHAQAHQRIAHAIPKVRRLDAAGPVEGHQDGGAAPRHRQRGHGLTCSVVRVHYRSEEHTSELQSLMRISYAVFCLKKKKIIQLSNKE